jgi:hypothetical protein
MEMDASLSTNIMSQLQYDSLHRSFTFKNQQYASDLEVSLKLMSTFNLKILSSIESPCYSNFQNRDLAVVIEKELDQTFIKEEYSAGIKTILKRFSTNAKLELEFYKSFQLMR